MISRVSVSLIMCTGGAYRPLRHDRHLSEASSFADGVERQARPRLAAIAFHLKPPEAAVEAIDRSWVTAGRARFRLRDHVSLLSAFTLHCGLKQNIAPIRKVPPSGSFEKTKVGAYLLDGCSNAS